MDEPEVIIDGKRLSVGEAMTLRVAISSFISDLSQNGLGEDDTGKAICDGYIRNGRSILGKMNCFKQQNNGAN